MKSKLVRVSLIALVHSAPGITQARARADESSPGRRGGRLGHRGGHRRHRRLRGQCRRGPDRYGFFGERGENRLNLPYVEIARAEVGEEDDQAALAASFFSVFFAGFYSPLQAPPPPPPPRPLASPARAGRCRPCGSRAFGTAGSRP